MTSPVVVYTFQYNSLITVKLDSMISVKVSPKAQILF